MNSFKKLFLITVFVGIGSFSAFYFVAKYISDNIKQEVITVQYLSSNIKYLTDLHTMCLLDHNINPNGKDILKDCKKLEKEIDLTLKHIQNNPYYSFYKNFIE